MDVHNTIGGSLQISTEVIAKIARLAALEVDGVSIGTLVQLYPVWRIGSRLPIVMGISFTFLSLAIAIAGAHGMGTS